MRPGAHKLRKGIDELRQTTKSFSSPPLFDMEARQHLNLKDPGTRNKIIDQFDKFGENFTKEEYGVDRYRVRRWKLLRSNFGSPAARFAESGKRSSLTPNEVRKLEKELLSDPFASNQKLSAKIKNKISPRQVGRVIARSSLEFTKKLEQVDVEQSFSPEIYQEGLSFMKEIKNISYDDRVYVDETFASAGTTRRIGRFPKAKKSWSKRNRKYPRMVICGAITKEGWFHQSKIWNKPSISDNDFDSYVKGTLAPRLRSGQVVFWDQYGKFGRTKNPQSRHFSPKARKAIEARGAKLKILPRYGKLLDPIELIFGDTKRNYDNCLREKLRSIEPSKLKFEQKVKIWREAENALSPKSFIRAFKERANGKEFLRVGKEKGLEK